MQVTEWNDKRKEAIEESEYLERFITDIGTHIESMENNTDKLEVIYKDSMLALAYLEGKRLKNIYSGRLIAAFYNSTSIFPYYTYDVTYNELMS